MLSENENFIFIFWIIEGQEIFFCPFKLIMRKRENSFNIFFLLIQYSWEKKNYFFE